MEDENVMSDEEKQMRSDMAAEIFEDAAPVNNAEDPERPEPVEAVEKVGPEPVIEPEIEDPWAGVPAALRNQIEGITSKLSGLDHIENRLKQTERRIGSIQNEFQNANKAAKEVKDAPTQEQMAAAATSKKAWDNLQDEFPDWADAFKYQMKEEIAATSAEFKKNIPDISDIRTSIDGIRGNMIAPMDLEKRLVAFSHPRWEQTIQGADYKAWLAAQPQNVQALTDSVRAEDAVYVLNQFKSFQSAKKPPGQTDLAKKKRLESAITPESTKKTRMVKSEADMTEQEIRDRETKRLWG